MDLWESPEEEGNFALLQFPSIKATSKEPRKLFVEIMDKML